MIRATTGGVLRSYRKNLMNSFISQNHARDTVLTQRKFNSYAEDPAAASKAFRLRKSRMMAETQKNISTSTYQKFQTAFNSLQSIDQLVDTENGGEQLNTLKSTTLKMLNDPSGDARTQLSKALSVMSETIVQNLNQKYADTFIFAGADGHNVPFEVKTVNGRNQLYYRGVSVDAAVPNVWKNGDTPVQVDANGNYAPGGGSYLKMDDVELMSVSQYESLYTPPTLESAGGAFKEYNADGTAYTGAAGEAGGYYQKLDAKGDPAGLISKDDYNAAVEKSKTAPNRLTDAGKNAVYVDKDGKVIPAPTTDAQKANAYYMVVDGDPKDQAMTKQEFDDAVEEAAKLETLVNEKRFVDIGLGFQEHDGKLIETSGYNDALHGITFVGYGLDADGDPKNIYSIVQRLSEIADNVPEEGKWSEDVYEEFRGLVLKLEDASSEFKTQFTNMYASTTKLKNNTQLLEDNIYNLQEQYSDLEDVNMAEAISAFIWAQYSYNAALKVGNSILSQSLMDYLQ